MQMDHTSILSFLFTLGSLELGQDYSKSVLTAEQRRMLDDLSDLGLIYQPSSSPECFYPTRLATTLTSDASALRDSPAAGNAFAQKADAKGFIIIETNFRIYAYTNSALQIAILQLFIRLSAQYPNMVAGKITRESIRRAVAMGITSDQIIAYLDEHAHPQMRKNKPILPPTVMDQIRLWQIEGERMKATPGFLFKDFLTAAEYEACARYADEIGVCVWRSDAKRMFFVTRHEQVAAFLKNNQNAGA
jgi:transcription initiation factor TFIIH subunit 4